MSIFDGKPKTDREIDLEASRDFYEDLAQLKHDALQAVVAWADAGGPLPEDVARQVRKALVGQR